MSSDFKTALREADAQWSHRALTPAVRARLDARVLAPPRRNLLPLLVAVGLASIGLGFGLSQLLTAPIETHALEKTASAFTAGEVIDDIQAGAKVSVEDTTVLRRDARGTRVVMGRVTFAVAKRKPDEEPMRVLVSGGAIEVHGTRFVVVETGDSGSVMLFEGAITFVDPRGAPHVLKPGESLTWPVPEPKAQPPEPLEELDELVPLAPLAPPPEPTSPPLPEWRAFEQRMHADAVFSEYQSLRVGAQWPQAVRLLERELDRGAPETRERVSFELGLLQTRQLKNRDAACAHWARHSLEYPHGRFDAAVTRLAASMNCR